MAEMRKLNFFWILFNLAANISYSEWNHSEIKMLAAKWKDVWHISGFDKRRIPCMISWFGNLRNFRHLLKPNVHQSIPKLTKIHQSSRKFLGFQNYESKNCKFVCFFLILRSKRSLSCNRHDFIFTHLGLLNILRTF